MGAHVHVAKLRSAARRTTKHRTMPCTERRARAYGHALSDSEPAHCGSYHRAGKYIRHALCTTEVRACARLS